MPLRDRIRDLSKSLVSSLKQDCGDRIAQKAGTGTHLLPGWKSVLYERKYVLARTSDRFSYVPPHDIQESM
eukprot:8602518-Ditylum_brightwellii.AAC.1